MIRRYSGALWKSTPGPAVGIFGLSPPHATEEPQHSAGPQMTEGTEMSEDGWRERCWRKHGEGCGDPGEPGVGWYVCV